MKKINKKFLFGLIIVFLLSLPAIFSLLHPGFFQSDDGGWMIIRFSAFYAAFKDLQIPVRFLTRLNFSYGYPVATFLYPGFMYFGVPIKILGFGFVNTIKIILGISIVGSGIFTYFWLSKRFKTLASITGALLYIYLPYHLYDVYTRGSVGEVFALLWVSFILWMIEKKSVFWTSIGIAALILAHNTLAVLFLPFLLLYALLKKDFVKKDVIISFIIGGLLSSFFSIPAILELKNTVFSHISISNPFDYFASLSVVDIASLFILVCSLILFIFKTRKKENENRFVLLFLIVGFLSIFFATQVSSFVWKIIPASFIQFPFRFLSVTILTVAFLGAFLVDQAKDYKKIMMALVLCIFVGITSDPYLTPKVFFDKGEGYYYTNDATTTVQNEYMPVWVKSQPTQAPAQKVEVIKGQAEITHIVSDNKQISFTVNANKGSTLSVNTIYWPGWKAEIDGKKTVIQYKNTHGLMNISVPSGTHTVLFSFGEDTVELIADGISLIALIALCSFVIISKKKTRE